MAKLIATDLDGTLFYPKKRIRMISPKSLKFIHKFIDEGNQLCLVSGRNLRYCLKVEKRIKRRVDFVGCNSSFIYVDGKVVKESYFNNEEITRILEEIKETYDPKSIMIMTRDGNFAPRSGAGFFYYIGYKLWYFFQGTYREIFTLDDKKFAKSFIDGKIYKIMLMFGVSNKQILRAKEVNKEIREKYKEYLEASWSDQVIELSPAGCSKAEGLKYYSDYLKINHDDVYVVGDSGNDISMFIEFHKNSFCMSRSSLSVSKHARHVVKHFWEIEKYIDERK